MPPNGLRGRRSLAALVPLLVLAVIAATIGMAGTSNAAERKRVAKTVPSTATPNIRDGAVYAIARVGDEVVVGGTFTKVANRGSDSVHTRERILAFDASSGTLDADFTPTLDGKVNALLPGPNGHTVYVGGSFHQVNGNSRHALALLDLATGKQVSTFDPPSISASVRGLAKSDGRLLVAGTFRRVGGKTHAGLASLSATSGALDPYLSVQLTGHHNYTGLPGEARGAVGGSALTVSPDGHTLVVIGNFTEADGLPRDQIVRIDLGADSATVDQDWATSAYTSRCSYWSFDGYVRDVRFSPDGSYFVVADTGGSHGDSAVCDSAARFDTADSGDVQPHWVDWTGGDTLLSVAVTSAVVYVGGHQRWLNNPNGHDSAGGGAVPRPGLGALDPRNGVPVAWNPGRHPRGVGTHALLATADGLYAGGDTNYIGNRHYYRGKIAFFPDAGHRLPAEKTGSLPGDLYLAQDAGLTRRSFDGTNVGGTERLSGTGVDWARVHGAFLVDNTLFYGRNDGTLVRRSFDGTTFGDATVIDPYDDPEWADVPTGSGQTYRGVPPNFYAQLPDVTGMVYAHGQLYYTLASRGGLYSRPFSPDSGIVGETPTTVSTKTRWNTSGGMVLAGDTLYFASTSSGNLYATAWSDGHPDGALTKVSGPNVDGVDWRNRAMFLRGNTPVVESPIGYVGADHVNGSGKTPSVSPPDGVQPGDALVLFVSCACENAPPLTGSLTGWKQVGREAPSPLITTAYVKVAQAGDADRSVGVKFDRYAKADLALLAYSGVDQDAPTAGYASAHDARTATHVTPRVDAATGDWVLSYWADKSSDTTKWTAPAAVTVRSTAVGSGGGYISTLVGDSGGPVAAGTYGGLTATMDALSGKATMWTVLLRPAS